MAFVDTGRKVTTVVDSVVSFNLPALTGTVVGNLVIVAVGSDRGGGPEPTLIVTDGANTWNNLGVAYTGDGAGHAVSLSWAILTTGGSRTINVSGNGSNSFSYFAAAHEFQNPHASPPSGATVENTGTGAVMDTTAVTPADNDVLVVAIGSCFSSGSITENQSPGDTGWTVSNESELSTGAPSSFVFKILSGSPGTPRHAWSNTSSAWATMIKAFKPAAATGGGADLTVQLEEPTLGVSTF